MYESNMDRAHEQSLNDLSKHRVRLPGYFNALAAQIIHSESPEEFDAEQIGIDQDGHGVFVVFWRTPTRGLA